jgi:hypothetical protein
MTDTMREAFEEAFDKAEQDAEKNAPEPVEPLPEPVEKTEPVETRQEDTHETEKHTDEAAPTDIKESAPSEKATAPSDKAPASWSPSAREAWGKLPKEAQAQIIKREKEVSDVLAQGSAARQVTHELNTLLAPHKERMIASGVQNPMQMIGNMLDAERRLSQGDQHARASTIANLIKGYGVDINVLDSLLAAEPAQQNPNSEIERMIEQRMAPVTQLLQQQQYYAQQQKMHGEQQAVQAVTQFGSQAEFINDVRMDMADLLDMAASRGQVLSLEDAYKKACAIHPEVSKVMSERERQQQIMGTQNTLSHKRNAAVSITGNQRGGTVQAANNLRDQIAQAWDNQLG